MPTGGVSPTKENLEAWFNSGVTCVGMGSKLIFKNKEGKYDFLGIEELTRFAINTIQEIKN